MAKRIANSGTTDRQIHQHADGAGRILEEYLSELKAIRGMARSFLQVLDSK